MNDKTIVFDIANVGIILYPHLGQIPTIKGNFPKIPSAICKDRQNNPKRPCKNNKIVLFSRLPMDNSKEIPNFTSKF